MFLGDAGRLVDSLLVASNTNITYLIKRSGDNAPNRQQSTPLDWFQLLALLAFVTDSLPSANSDWFQRVIHPSHGEIWAEIHNANIRRSIEKHNALCILVKSALLIYTYVYIYIYIYIYICVCVCVYIDIYAERERKMHLVFASNQR